MVSSPQVFLLGLCECCRQVNRRGDILSAVFPPVTATFAGAHWRVTPCRCRKTLPVDELSTDLKLDSLKKQRNLSFYSTFWLTATIAKFSACTSQWKSRYDYSIRCYASDRKVTRSCHCVSESTANNYNATRHSVTFTLHHGLSIGYIRKTEKKPPDGAPGDKKICLTVESNLNTLNHHQHLISTVVLIW